MALTDEQKATIRLILEGDLQTDPPTPGVYTYHNRISQLCGLVNAILSADTLELPYTDEEMVYVQAVRVKLREAFQAGADLLA